MKCFISMYDKIHYKVKKNQKQTNKQQQQQQKGNEMDLWREDKTRPS